MKTLFPSGRTSLNDTDWTISSNDSLNGTSNLPAGTYNFSLQAKTILGKNFLIKKSYNLTTSNSPIIITINPSALQEYEYWTTFIIGYSTSGIDSDFHQIREIRIKEIGNYNIFYTLPISIVINNLESISILNFNDFTSLQQSNNTFFAGQIIKLLSNNFYYQYIKDLYSESDNLYIFDSNQTNYKWKYIKTPYCFINDLTTVGGCNQEVKNFNDDTEFEEVIYNADGSYSLNLDYLIFPEDTASNKFIIDFGIFIGSLNFNSFFKNKIQYLIKGIYNQNTYSFREITDSLNNSIFLDYIPWNLDKDSVEYIQESLSLSEAFLISVQVKFYLDEFLVNIPDNSYIRILPYLKTDLTVYNSFNYINYGKGFLFYSLDGDYLRLLPSDTFLSVQKGSGIINGISFPLTNLQEINNLPNNTENILIKLNSTGLVYYDNNTLTNNEVQRAIVSTKITESDVVNLFVIKGLTLNIIHPKDSFGFAFIREDYPDIIKNKKAYFNPTGFNLYLKNLEDNSILKFVFNSILDSVNLDINTGISVLSIPTKQVTGFFKVENILSNTSDSNYLIGLSYTYDGSVVSDISHSVLNGSIIELPSQYSNSNEVEASLGSSAFLNAGTNIDNLVQLIDKGDNTPSLPPVDGSLLLGVDKVEAIYKNSNFNAETGKLYLVDTSISSFTCYLPLNSLNGKIIHFKDYSGITYKNPTGFGKNSFIIDGQSKLINGQATLEIDIENAAFSLVFLNDSWSLFADFKPIHTTQSLELNLSESQLLLFPPNTKGDIWTYGTSHTKLSIGTKIDNYFLVTDSNQPSGLIWRSPSYTDLTDKPTLFSGSYTDLTNKPTLFSGSYTDLTNKPTLFSGSYTDLTNKPTLFSGSYIDLTDKPTLFSGSYIDLTDKPILFSGSYIDLTDKPILFSGSYIDLTDKPTFRSAAYLEAGTSADNVLKLDNQGKLDASLIDNLPSIPLTVKGDILTHDGITNSKISIGTNIDNCYLVTDSNQPSGLIWRSPSYTDLTNVPTFGSAAYLEAANLVQLDVDGKLPIIDGSQLTNLPSGLSSPLFAKGDIWTYGLIDSQLTNTRLELGGNNQVLIVDIDAPSGLRWASINNITGLGQAALYNVGINANELVALEDDGVLPSLDARNLRNIPIGNRSSLTTIGDLCVYSPTNTRFPVGSNNQVLIADSNAALGMKWESYDYNNLTNKPILGSAAYLNADNTANNIVKLNGTGKINSSLIDFPIGLTSPLATTGALWTYGKNGTKDTALEVGTTNGQVLLVDSNADLGIKWGSIAYSSITGTPTLGSAAYLNADNTANNIVKLNGTGKINSSLIDFPAGLASPVTTKGALWTYGTTDVALAVGTTNGQVLLVDSSQDTGLRWGSIPYSSITGTPTLGSAAYLNADNTANNIVKLNGTGKINSSLIDFPAGLASPVTTKGALWTYGTTDTALTVGTTDGQVLLVDNNADLGIKWGSIAYSSITGTPTLGSAAYLNADNTANNIVKLNGTGKINSSLIDFPAGLASPVTTKGALWTYGTTDVALAVGTTDGQVLLVDSNADLGIKWGSIAYSTITGTPTLGSAAYLNADNSANNIVKLNETGKINSSLIDFPAFVSLDTANTFTKAQSVATVALTDGTSIAVNASLSNVFSVTLGGNRTLANPTNLVPGTSIVFLVKQDATGNRTLSYGTAFKWSGGIAPTLTTTANKLDVISCITDGTNLYCSFIGNF